jgi:hypothetical protein
VKCTRAPCAAHQRGVGGQQLRLGLEVHDHPALVAAQVVHGAVHQQRAVVDQHQPRAQRLDVVHVVGGEQHRGAALAVLPAHEVAHGELRGGVEADGGLVEKQDLRPVQQRRGQVAAHALAEAQLAHRGVEQRREVEHGHQLVEHGAVVGRAHPVDVAQQLERLHHRQVPPELGALAEHHADGRRGPPGRPTARARSPGSARRWA